MYTRIEQFLNDESGAVTVDWVVLTAAIVGLGVAVISTVGGGVNNVGSTVGSKLSSAVITADLSNLGQ